MRWRALVLSVLTLAILACTGSVDNGGKKGKKPGAEEPADGGGGGWLDDLPGMGGGEDDTDDGDTDAGEGGGGGGGGGTSPKPAPGTKPAPAPTTPPDGIVQVNSTTWEISKAKKKEILDHPSRFASASKKKKGYQLKSIKSGKDAWWAGLRNGDVVQVVNGYHLANQAEALQAYSQLQDAKTIRVKIRRGESFKNHTYNVK